MKNLSKVMMAVVIILVAWLLLAIPEGAFGHDLTNPVLDHLDATGVSYIAKMEGHVLIIYLIKGSVDLDQLGDLANLYDVRIEIRDLS
jgi:hypothetical protein